MASTGSFATGETAATLWEHITSNIISPIIDLLALAAFVVFVWGVVTFIRSADDAEKRATGQQHMVWGIIGLVIIFGAQAIMAIITNTFGFGS
jgi:hypothetical protein